jgi:hypothetical protein
MPETVEMQLAVPVELGPEADVLEENPDIRRADTAGN